ncbi:MAG TPA: hypothetical protein VFC19_33385 [Candidatus Limnocylindrales bacterium]|nr:hypothetical protein [Candidatus Limnocylindrales bacterium]
MGFGYKTSWIAVRGRTPEEVADALGLTDRRPMAYAEGTDAAYRAGVYVAPPVQGWILAHGRVDRTIDVKSAQMLDWLSDLSKSLGTVQYFGTHRVTDWHEWAWAEHGSIVRAYAFSEGDVALFVGDVTGAERMVGKGLRDHEPDMDSWSDEQWDSWYESAPGERHVMRIAGMWSVDPMSFDDNEVDGVGIYGVTAA